MTPSPSPPATRAALLTPIGAGAIAVLAVRGPLAWSLAQELFRPRSQTSSWPPTSTIAGQFWLGRFGDDGTMADEVVLALQRVEPVPWVELHCHGGIEVVRWLLDTLQARGVQICPWQELERKTANNSLQAVAAAALVHAPTPRTAAVLLDQYHGVFEKAVQAVLAALARDDLDEAIHLFAALIRHDALGRRLTNPWRVAVLGAPNVGKSSLVNALAGYQRSVVAPTPGTTRDVVTTRIAVDGWPVELADTAGLRDTVLALEGQGIERAQAAGREADLCLWFLDASAPPVWPTELLARVQLVVNKIDLPAVWETATARGAVQLSATTGDGIPELCELLSRWLVPNPPPPGAAVPFTPALADAVIEACRLCRAGKPQDARLILEKILAGNTQEL